MRSGIGSIVFTNPDPERWTRRVTWSDLLIGGINAGSLGKSPCSCPFALDTEEWHTWYAGWLLVFRREI
jgi:hypothetical protein